VFVCFGSRPVAESGRSDPELFLGVGSEVLRRIRGCDWVGGIWFAGRHIVLALKSGYSLHGKKATLMSAADGIKTIAYKKARDT
jgi:hypothetical protein